MPAEPAGPCLRVESAVAAGGVLIIVLTWPVTVVTMVVASVAIGVVLDGFGLGDAFGDRDVTSVLPGACAAPHVSAIQSKSIYSGTIF
jgi:hypothetical protein